MAFSGLPMLPYLHLRGIHCTIKLIMGMKIVEHLLSHLGFSDGLTRTRRLHVNLIRMIFPTLYVLLIQPFSVDDLDLEATDFLFTSL